MLRRIDKEAVIVSSPSPLRPPVGADFNEHEARCVRA